MTRRFFGFLFLATVLLLNSSCAPAIPDVPTLPASADTATALPTSTAPAPPTETAPAVTQVSPPTAVLPVTGHVMQPADVPPPADHIFYDVRSAGRKRAPYGDSYDINRLERPFLQDMKYVSELDIVSFEVSEDADWYYVSILLSGNNPNNKLGIDYGVELDQNMDGFGDILIWATPPYGKEWTTKGVQVYRDTNHDTAGLSSGKSDPGFTGDGYETLIFDGTSDQGEDRDLAWVHLQKDTEATMHFAFKKALSGPKFLIGVMADAGLKDVSKLDYNDRFKASEAGSPIRGYSYYPLKMLYAVDNTCWEAYGMKNPLNVAKVCPPEASEPITAKPPSNDLASPPLPTVKGPTATKPPATDPPATEAPSETAYP
jgi:hypothetical protein